MKIILRFFKLWTPGFLLCVLLDFIFLGYVASGFFKRHLEPLLDVADGRMNVNVPAALATWALLVGGIYLFVLPLSKGARTLTSALVWGAVYGFVVYGVYELTNLATLKDWPFIVTVVDMTWGACVCGVVAFWMEGVRRLLKCE